jgi:DNA replication and repair protein RecF
MRIKRLKLNNFRNFNEGDIALNDGMTVFYGGVGEGKTNLIEAVFMLSVGRSYRTSVSDHVIAWGKGEAYVRGEGKNSVGDFSVAIKVSKTEKLIELNGESNKKAIELIGGLRSVVFHSEDIVIISGSPAARRRYIDLAISQASKNYVYNLRDYYKVLRQRNSALIRHSQPSVGEWDEQLATLGSWLTKVRGDVIEELAKSANTFVGALAGDAKKLDLRYMASGAPDRSRYMAMLSRSRDIDTLRGSTQIGPHRDDIKITLGGADARHFSSSGEKKTIALALKLAEVELLRGVTGEKPIMLLDDLFSTLDVRRSKALLEVTGDGSQCIVTLTDLNLLKEELNKGAVLYEVKGGAIKQEI